MAELMAVPVEAGGVLAVEVDRLRSTRVRPRQSRPAGPVRR